MKTVSLNNFDYERKFGVKIDENTIGYATEDQASMYAKLYMNWWGGNLVFLGHEKINGLFVPKFNVFD